MNRACTYDLDGGSISLNYKNEGRRSFSLESKLRQANLPSPLPGRSQFPRKREVRKVRTPQGNVPHESEGREPRGTRTDSAAERYRRWTARSQARVKWWSKSPPRIRVTGRHGKPRVVQDRTGEGRPARFNLRVLVALCASRALRSGGVREMAVQLRKGGTESGLQGSGTPSGPTACRLHSHRRILHTNWAEKKRCVIDTIA
jgi:hypothetical protein